MKSIQIEKTWKEKILEHIQIEEYKELAQTLQNLYLTKAIYPHPKKIFNAFNLCPFDKVRVVILGQDPYHGKGQAHGLSFSVEKGVPKPPSLQNILKEIQDDVGVPIPENGDLSRLAEQGVFLLNSILTVEAGKPGSHASIGWEAFTDQMIELLSYEKEHLVFLLWGNYAKNKIGLIDAAKHCILRAPHPSPFSAHTGFMGCKHFSKTNKYLEENSLKPIEW